ncbi:GLIPR1-like protein 1 [Ostrea edulis]|uniref:GLIPR1-like protein 1 n=1 Tax=Ostrea edulis TaxID=37623 RepID=UPI0024AFF39E|nr:GLIPR1-like protein 1 [Ostrea edulis]
MKTVFFAITVAACFGLEVGALTQFEQQFLDAHNTKRRGVSPTATNMRELKWSAELASVAQNYANKCIWGHNENKYEEAPSFERVGENIAWRSGQTAPLDVVTNWDNEKNLFNYFSNSCTGDCSHYTQVVWAETEYVGCAVAHCSPLEGVNWDPAYYYVCNYGERGNMNGDRPYVNGSPCSQCPSGYTCNDKLCSS